MNTQTLPQQLYAARGATTVAPHTPKAYTTHLVALLTTLCQANHITPPAIVAVWFTVTPDLTCDNPARIARTHLPGWEHVAMLCATEPTVEDTPQATYPSHCVRVLIQWYGAPGHTPQFTYQNGCQTLRS